MSHDATFPDSAESPERRSERALEALEYENSAGLGFRRRDRKPLGNPYADPERYQVDRDPTTGELWAGLLVGLGAVLGFASLFYKPLLLGTVGLVGVVLGSLGDGAPARIARIAMPIIITCFLVGMLMSLFLTDKAVF